MKRCLVALVLATLLLAGAPASPGAHVMADDPGGLADLATIEVLSISPPPGTPYEVGYEAEIDFELVLRYQLHAADGWVRVRVGLGDRSIPHPYFCRAYGALTSRSGTSTIRGYFDRLSLSHVFQWVRHRGGDLADGLYVHIEFTTGDASTEGGLFTATTYTGPFTYGNEEIRDGIVAVYPLVEVAQPRDLTAARVDGRVVLTWNPPSGTGKFTPTGYALYRSTDPEGELTLLGTTEISRTSFVDTRAEPGVSYTYAVKAYAGEPTTACSVPATAVLTDPAGSSLWVNRPPGEGPPTGDPPVTCAVITTEDLRQAFVRLACSKTRRGTPTVVYTTDWIYCHYPEAPDHSARIKALLTDLSVKQDLEYVILGGDAQTVPTRIIITGDGCFPFYPTDHYYADLSDWDGNRNGLYADCAGDRPDLRPELIVGRLPVSTPELASWMVDRLLSYEKAPPAGDWYTRAVLAGGVISYPEEGEGGEVRPKNDGAVIVEEMASRLLPVRYDRVTLYERGGVSPSNYPSDLPLDAEHFASAISEGCSLVFAAAHGWKTYLYSLVWTADHDGDGLSSLAEEGFNHFIQADPGPLPANGPKLPFVFAEACQSADFTYHPHCLGERLLTDGSVIGYVGSTFVAYSTSDWTPDGRDDYGRTLTWYFWEEFFGSGPGAGRPGEALALAKKRYAAGISSADLYARFGGHLETLAEFILLGDPEMLVWTDTPREMILEVMPSVDSLVVTVKDGTGQPLDGVQVCVWDGGEQIHLVSSTAEDGIARFNLPGSVETVLDVTAFIPGYLWGEAHVAVTPEGARLVEVATDDLDGLPEAPDLRRLVALEVMSGYGDGRLGPGDLVTREQFAKMLLLASGIEPDPDLALTFADAEDVSPWARPFVATAAARGLVTGVGGNRFAPLDNVTRSQVLTMMARALGAPETLAATPFPDDAAIPNWARGPVNFALAVGLLSLEDFEELAPGTLATRAECALFLSRYVDLLRES